MDRCSTTIRCNLPIIRTSNRRLKIDCRTNFIEACEMQQLIYLNSHDLHPDIRSISVSSFLPNMHHTATFLWYGYCCMWQSNQTPSLSSWITCQTDNTEWSWFHTPIRPRLPHRFSVATKVWRLFISRGSWFPQYVQANVRIIPSNKPRPSSIIPNSPSLFLNLFDAIWPLQ